MHTIHFLLCLSVSLSVSASVVLTLCLPVHLSVCLSVSLSLSLSPWSKPVVKKKKEPIPVRKNNEIVARSDYRPVTNWATRFFFPQIHFPDSHFEHRPRSNPCNCKHTVDDRFNCISSNKLY